MSRSPGFIYGLVDPDTLELRYVGLTRARHRLPLKRHLANAAGGSHTHVCNWIRTLPCAPSLLVLERDPTDGLEAAERRWIARTRLLGAWLTNLTDGGDGQPGYRHTEETKRRISKAQTGRRCSADCVCGLHLGKAGKANRGRHHSAETRAAMSAVRRGRPWTAERRAAYISGKKPGPDGPVIQPVRSCGLRHAWCLVCRPQTKTRPDHA